MEESDSTLVIIVPGKCQDHGPARLHQIADEYCTVAGLPSPVATTGESLCPVDPVHSPAWSAALLLTDGNDSATEGLLLLEAHRAILPRTVDWIDYEAAQRPVRLRKLDALFHDGVISEGLDEAAVALADGIAAADAPLGYMKDAGGRLVVGDPLDCELVRFIFQAYVESTLSRARICHLLNAQEVSGLRSARTWGGAALASILCDVRYAGSVRFGGWVRDGCHPALIAMEQFEAAQTRLRSQIASTARAHCRPARGFTPTEAIMP